MNKITRLYFFMVLSVTTAPTAIFANYHSSSMAETHSSSQQQQMYNHDPYNQENQNDDSNPVIIGEGSWETASSRMNRQAAAISNTRSNPNQNKDEQTKEGSWETTSSRMNRQSAAAANTRSNSTWIRVEDRQNRHDSNTTTRGNAQR